jgi:hypothetical protein
MIAGLASAMLGLAIAACTDSAHVPVAPTVADASPHPAVALTSKSATKTRVNAIRWREPLDGDLTASAVIGPAGGVLTLPATGLRLVVPPGAVDRPTRFGATALAGKLAAYDFEPAGSVFPIALRVEQDSSFLALKGGDPTRATAGYFANRSDVDQARGTSDVAELSPITWSARAIAFPVWHFSGYIMSWGRSASE